LHERYGDSGAVTVTIETEDNNKDTKELANAVDRAIQGIKLFPKEDGTSIGDLNIQTLDLHETTTYKTPKLIKS